MTPEKLRQRRRERCKKIADKKEFQEWVRSADRPWNQPYVPLSLDIETSILQRIKRFFKRG